MSQNAAVKTLYTARFFETPSSSDSTRPPSSKPQPSAYLEGLFQTHVALNQMEEVPDSRPNSPDRVDPERVEALRKQVVEAFNAAKNPASGKWGILANLLQTGTAKGKYRYITTTADDTPPDPGPDGWILPDTEEEWLALEKKRKEDRRRAEIRRQDEENRRKEDEKLYEKIETWQRSIDHVPPSDLVAVSLENTAHTRNGVRPRPIKSTTPPSDGDKPASRTTGTMSHLVNSRARSVAALPEPAFLPPSFPSQLKTSTPAAANRYKPPIVLAPSSSPLSSPTRGPGDIPAPSSTLSSPIKRLLDPGPSSSSISLPAKGSVDVAVASCNDLNSPSKPSPPEEVPSSSSVSSPPKNTRVYGRPRPESPLKRPRSPSPTPVPPAKKPRAALPSFPVPASGSAASSSSPGPSKLAARAPLTPPRSVLPKLADLIAASAQKKSKAKSKEREKQKGKAKAHPPVKPNSESPPPRVEDKEEEPQDMSKSPDADEMRRPDLEVGIEVAEDDMINWDSTMEAATAGWGMDALASPSKSLSSIDGSNSLESQDSNENDMPEFSSGRVIDLQGGSTQPMGMLEGGASLTTTERGGRGFGQPQEFDYPMQYESQMDVESNMQGVEELLDADVRFAGPWMGRGPDDDDEDQWGGQGSGQIDSSP
ncbi:hypothetical protein B0H15DRAFT_795062 [Mycena belliarum]|uniref:Uncharacterized protein n=1 Tax=Mycena belliarum TaxID=1033014 RepID=A0AAD6UIU9_9AGAR|nr:hypothetical protein B0H15DRAFT_795062 [Mycena belliae]